MGSISSYETKDGRRYRAHYRDPERRNREKAGFKRKRDAEEFLAAVVVTSLKGEYVDPAQGKATIHDLGMEWLANQSHLKPSSLSAIEVAWRVHVEPSWGPAESPKSNTPNTKLAHSAPPAAQPPNRSQRR